MRFLNIPTKSAFSLPSLGLAVGIALSAASAQAEKVVVTFTNEGPENGIFVVNPWIAFHDGTFNTFSGGTAASAGIEAVAEDGNTGPLDAAFQAANPGATSATLAGPAGPGDSKTYIFDLDPNDPNNRYLSYVIMLIPSNDAFAGNSTPTTYEIFDADGNFVARPINIPGSAVYDAGTEVNDEIPENVAFLAQAAPNTGETENGTVALHPGFMPLGSGGILDATRPFGGGTINFANGDFTADGYTLGRISVTQLGNPDTSSRLINISTRSFAGSGDNTQIAGFVVEGEDLKQVLIRGIGPALGPLGVNGALSDPTVGVFTSDGEMIAWNDDIDSQEEGQSAVDDLRAATVAVGAFGIPPGSLDAGILVWLEPGVYSAQVLPKDGEEGIALIEVYEVQN